MPQTGTGVATLTFPASPQAAQYRSSVVVEDSAPNPYINAGIWPVYPTSGQQGAWMSMAFGNGVFVAVSAGNGSEAATSTNGITWTLQSIPGATAWYSVAFGNGVFVAVGGNALTVAATSTDGVTWTQQTMPTSADWNNVCFGGGVFLALGQSVTNAATSADGVTWTPQTMPVAGAWTCATYGNGLFVVMLSGSTYYTSPDGANWTTRTLTIANSGANWNAIAFGGGVFVAVAFNTRAAAYSSDGVTWAASSLPTSASWRGIAYGNGVFVAVSSQSDDKIVSSSDGGKSWTQGQMKGSSTNGWWAVGYGAGTFSALPQGLTTNVAASPNGYDSGLVPLLNTRTVSTVNTETMPAAPVPGSNIASVTVTGLPDITATSSASAFIDGSDTTTDRNAYEHENADIRLSCDNFVPGVGFTINATSDVRLDGDVKVRYVWRA